jgi:hypothetical protein
MTAAQPRSDEGTFCDHCGAPAAARDHASCRRMRELEPPRYCPVCARRLIVQVVPRGWSARCSRHPQVS